MIAPQPVFSPRRGSIRVVNRGWAPPYCGLGGRHPRARTFEWLARKMLGSARSVTVVFPPHAREAERHLPGTDAEIVYNVPVEPRPNMRVAAALRREWAPAGEP